MNKRTIFLLPFLRGFGFLTAALILAIWGLIFMCICRVKTGQWWMTDDI